MVQSYHRQHNSLDREQTVINVSKNLTCKPDVLLFDAQCHYDQILGGPTSRFRGNFHFYYER